MSEIALSVVVGGVIGLANLWLWSRLVSGVIARMDGESVSAGSLLLKMLLKLLILLLLFVLAWQGGLNIIGLAAGFGAALFGLTIFRLFEKPQKSS